MEGAEFLARALAKSLARERPKPDRPLAFILLSGRSTAGDGAFVERKRESEAAFTRVASAADWSGSLIARLPPIDAFGYDVYFLSAELLRGRRRPIRLVPVSGAFWNASMEVCADRARYYKGYPSCWNDLLAVRRCSACVRRAVFAAVGGEPALLRALGGQCHCV